MPDSQFEQLLNGLSLMAAETHIANVLADLNACGIKPPRCYSFPGAAYALAELFREKIKNWDEAPQDFDFDEFFTKTFGKIPPRQG
jgi:hypothetical protein